MSLPDGGVFLQAVARAASPSVVGASHWLCLSQAVASATSCGARVREALRLSVAAADRRSDAATAH